MTEVSSQNENLDEQGTTGRINKEMRWDSVEPGKRQGVYAVFVKGTDNCLYVGESSNLRSRVNGHYFNSKPSDLRGMVKEDDDPPVEVDDLQYVTEVRIMEMPGSDPSQRRTVEEKLSAKLGPTYPRNSD